MHRRAIGVVVAIVLAFGAPGAWARDKSDWTNLQRLKAGTAVRVVLKSGDRLLANFELANDTSIHVNMLDGSGTRDVPRDDVKSVTRLHVYPPPGPNAQKWLLTGAAIGAVTGATVGAVRDVNHGTNYQWAEGAFGGALFGVMGSVVLFGGSAFVRAVRFHSDKVVYAAR